MQLVFSIKSFYEDQADSRARSWDTRWRCYETSVHFGKGSLIIADKDGSEGSPYTIVINYIAVYNSALALFILVLPTKPMATRSRKG